MEEAERFDWLVAMDAGSARRPARRQQLKAQTGARDLEDAFIALLAGASARRVTGPAHPAAPHQSMPSRSSWRAASPAGSAISPLSTTSASAIERGEIFGFVGSNGCGKTTTMKMLTGLLPASEGEALLFGRPSTPAT